MAVDAYKQKSADSGNGFGGGGGGGVGGMQRGASPLMDSGGLPGFGESSGYRAYQQQVGNHCLVITRCIVYKELWKFILSHFIHTETEHGHADKMDRLEGNRAEWQKTFR